MCWILFVVLCIYLLLLLLFYPLTLMLRIEDGKLRIYWLPRVFAGYSRPLLLVRTENKKKHSWSTVRKRLLAVKKIWRLIRLPRLEQIYFDFLLRNPGPDQLQAECIISYTLSDIISKHIRHRWRRWRRQNYGKRTRNCFFDE